MVCYILVEYADFIVKYFRDLEKAKQQMARYFTLLPFNQYLFLKYLEFMKNFENN